MRRALFAGLLCLVLPLVTSCRTDDPLVVGSKASTDNQILAELVARLARSRGVPVFAEVPYGNTFDCQEALKQGMIDIYPEYTGTGLATMGMPPITDPEAAYERVRELYHPFGLRWSERLGFDNSYVLVMRTGQAATHDITTISDLAARIDQIRLGADPEYMARTVDGMASLARRYGFHAHETVVVSSSKKRLYHALLNGEVDVVVGFATDGYIERFDFRLVEDDLGFFPSYQAGLVHRAEVLEEYPALEGVLRDLAGLLDGDSMRRLDKEVELNGASPGVVAADFLKRSGLLQRPRTERLEQLYVAIPPSGDEERFSRLNGLALAAVRYANPGRQVRLRPTRVPVLSVEKGYSFVAVLGAESFYTVRPGKLPALTDKLEAVAALGNRTLHLLGRRGRYDPDAQALARMRSLGVGLENSGAHRVATFLRDAYGLSDSLRFQFGSDQDLLDRLDQGAIDGLIEMVEVGGSQIAVSLQNEHLTLYPLLHWAEGERQFKYPFLRQSRIPPGIYPGVDRQVETLSAQVVIAGPAPRKAAFGDGGPSSAIRTIRKPIPRAIKKRLAASIGNDEMIDPMLPGKDVGVRSRHRPVRSLTPPPGVPLLCGLVLALVSALVYSILRD